MAGIKIQGLNKFYGGVQALKEINLEIEDGEFVVFVGPSGCGKSTLLRTLAGLESAASGTIEIAGKDVTNAEPVDRGGQLAAHGRVEAVQRRRPVQADMRNAILSVEEQACVVAHSPTARAFVSTALGACALRGSRPSERATISRMTSDEPA